MENYQQNNIPHHLILEQMERELSPDELEDLEQWKASSPENLAVYNALRDAADRLTLLDLYHRVDTNDAWNKISIQVQAAQEVSAVRKKGRLRGMVGVLAAAAIIIAVSVIAFKWISPAGEMIYRTAKNERRQLVLPDGSAVFLNENSTLSYGKRSFHKKRHVKLLKGEAYFVVVHDDTNEFLVESDEVVVRDMGTRFDLKMGPGKIEVIVSSGNVSMERVSANPQKVVIAANQTAIFDRDTKEISYTTVVPSNYKEWLYKKLRYVQTPLAIVCRDLNLIYGTQVILQDTTLKDRKLSAFFDQETEDQIMHIIATSLQLKVIKKDSIFILSQ